MPTCTHEKAKAIERARMLCTCGASWLAKYPPNAIAIEKMLGSVKDYIDNPTGFYFENMEIAWREFKKTTG